MILNIFKRLSFGFYIKKLKRSPINSYKTFDNYFLCPCCHYPTLKERRSNEICLLCDWEDDGQDDHNADKVLGGPNQDYSLTEARQNFIQYLTSFRPSDTYHFERTTVEKTFEGKVSCNLTEIKMQIIKKYNLAMTTNDEEERKLIFETIASLENKFYL